MKQTNSQQNKQAGITLLLSILILAAVSAIAFSLATVLFIEIRSSGDLVRTEPALYATQGVLEQAIFKIKRSVSDTLIPESDGTPNDNCSVSVVLACVLNNVATTTQISPYQDNPLTDLVLPSSDTYLNTKNSYYLLDPTDPYTDGDGNGSPDGNYTQIVIKNEGIVSSDGTAQADLEVALCRIDNTSCVDETTGAFTPSTEDIGPITLNPGDQTDPIDASDNLVPESSYALYVINTSPASDPANGFVKITSSPTGLPYFGKKAVNVIAKYLGQTASGLTRKYKAIVPEGGGTFAGTGGSGSGPFLSDTFTETSDKSIALHTSDTGQGYTKHFAATYSSGDITISSSLNRAYPSGAGASFFLSNATPPAADYTVSADFKVVTATGNAAIYARAEDQSANGEDGYQLRANVANGQWELRRISDGSGVFIGTGNAGTGLSNINFPTTGGPAVNASIQVSGSTISVAANGATIITATDSTYAQAKRTGLRFSGPFSPATGIHIDNLIAQ